jgi:RimJ/RimL family protein N-acetyltransferase
MKVLTLPAKEFSYAEEVKKWVSRFGEYPLIGIDELVAVVKTENLPSIKIFEKLGYSGEEKDDLIIYRKKGKC